MAEVSDNKDKKESTKEEKKKKAAEKEKKEKKKKEQINKKAEEYEKKIAKLKSDMAAAQDPTKEAQYEKQLTKATENYKKFKDANSEYINSSDGGEGGEESASSSDDTFDFTIDSSFSISFSEANGLNMSDDDYLKRLEEVGLSISGLRGVLGLPTQLLPLADVRVKTEKDKKTEFSLNEELFGITYSEKIIKNIPLLLITPGKPSFMSSFSAADKAVAVAKIFGGEDDAFNELMANGSGKYYTLKYDYVSYFGYVNTMLRGAATFLGIDGISVDGQKLEVKNWLYENAGDLYGRKGLLGFLGPYAGCIAIYCNGGTEISDSFSNSTTQSQLLSQVNGLSETGREINFLMGTVGATGGLGDKLTKLTGAENLEERINEVNEKLSGLNLGEGNIFSNIVNKAQTLLAGGKLIFPEIWADSSFGRSYSCSMKLVSVSGDKISIYLKILVPIYFILALVLPRQSEGQAYFSPFLIRAYYKGLFNVDMGIITDLSITKGDEGEWTIDGIPTVADVSFTIKDLYEGLAMIDDSSLAGGLFANVTEMDYIATSCGVNINDHDIARQAKLFAVAKGASLMDKITSGIFGNIAQFFNQKLDDLFGMF